LDEGEGLVTPSPGRYYSMTIKMKKGEGGAHDPVERSDPGGKKSQGHVFVSCEETNKND